MAALRGALRVLDAIGVIATLLEHLRRIPIQPKQGVF
jgi:hypothetical protein